MNKTKMRLSLLMALCVAASLSFFGCASAPTAEINATKAAVTAAQTDDIRTYAPDSLKTAEDTLAKATEEVQTQDGKSSFSRDYKGCLGIPEAGQGRSSQSPNRCPG